MPLGAFNVDVAWPWVTALKPGAPSVLSSFLHHDPSTNQTCLLVTRHSTKKTSAPLHRCAISIIPDEIACHPVENISMPKGSYKGVTVVRNHHGILVCIQVQARQPSSLNSELTGACSLLSPSLDLQAHAYFSDLDLHVELGGYSRSKGGSSGENKKPARGPRAAEEEEDEEEEAGEKRQISFALVQYGYVIQTEFDLRDSQDVMASLARVQSIVQVKNVTKTASAMQHVLDNIFTPSRGSRKKASKVMVVLTDGDIFGDPLNLTTVINSPKMQGIERFAIGVGDAFKKAKTDRELKLIASDPKETHTFKVTNYMALDGLLSKLQQSIIHMEGTVGDALQYQLAQTGFSAQILDKGQVLLGTVGAFNWSGGALLYDTRSGKGSFLNQTAEDSGAAQYSYLGYSVAVLHMVFGFSYVAGAPRHKIRGAVFQLQKEDRKATFVRRLEGEQMGSYFGSELCSVDIDMDGTTDFLLVAAPFYHIRGEEGRVYVYRVHEQDASFSLARTLSGHPGLTNSRFGFAMAAVGDINQDKFTDVAIGAPLEGFEAGDGTSYGSVYIYNGHSDGLRASPSQWVLQIPSTKGGRKCGCGTHLLGSAWVSLLLSSQQCDFGSQPVVDLAVSMTFIPAALPMFFKDNVDVELCFEVASSTTASNPGLREMSLHFTVDVDVTKQRKRLQCTNTTNCQSYLRNWNGESSQCEQLSFIPMEEKLCDGDCFSNITIKVSYEFQTLGGKGDHPNPILDHYKDPSAVFQLPYEKDCKNKVFCIAEVQLTTAISQQELVVGVTKELSKNISLTNSGEDSYMTNMALNYPRNLQFKRIQKPLSPDIQCDEPKPVASVLVVNCKIGHPILKRSSIFQPDVLERSEQTHLLLLQHVQEWHSVICDITSNKENVTVAAEISLGHTKQLLRDVTELQILGEISFNKSLYEGLSAENHRTQITVIFLRDEEPNSLPLIIGSSIGGLLLLVVIIAILFKCGFFKRKYQQLNLESIRRTQLKADSLLVED
ncbi:Integrin alpha-E [Cricetulus griseus]|uniref:Integrin alpha-E n=1 Tax=Cricetulus griseus TaxID=10029 RepID=G3I1N6_CRIGR|nr:Integrin alpha-E [Cricetulus griseus]